MGTNQMAHAPVQPAAATCEEEAVPSPCIGVCRMTEDRSLCQGCFRSSEEIRAWRQLDASGKHAIWRRIEERSAGKHALALLQEGAR